MLEEWIKENVEMRAAGKIAVVNDEVRILPPRAFSGMPLEKVILPHELRKIGAYSFAECSSLEVVNIPPQVVLIDDAAFCGCSSLRALTIPDKVVGLGAMTFAGTGLSRLDVPKSVRYIDNGAFANCDELKKITLPSEFYDIPYERWGYLFVPDPNISMPTY